MSAYLSRPIWSALISASGSASRSPAHSRWIRKSFSSTRSTAYLDHREVESVLGALLKLKREGMTIAFVSHHLDEVRAIADQLTILKDGASCRHLRNGGHRTGRESTAAWSAATFHKASIRRAPRSPRKIRAPRLPSRRWRVAVGQELSGATLEVRAGEILGLAGLKGAGADGLFAAISGDKPLTQGRMRFAGADYAPATPAAAWRAGVAHLPGDRTGEGLISDFRRARQPRHGATASPRPILQSTRPPSPRHAI